MTTSAETLLIKGNHVARVNSPECEGAPGVQQYSREVFRMLLFTQFHGFKKQKHQSILQLRIALNENNDLRISSHNRINIKSR
jgi:hypothetical protein